ncbi:xanthine phosphoribosyltransferase [Aliagarivorans taiwanensis]|uniref:xanthine phosphoribosyltransferase n=1 Tax=Aliagarivorans taiwanensis TaxID=561966 RepID=UPI0003F593F9|nr:xanthine phosphoribosyltransferase [Aliagarivorans taiwanensis]
MQYQQQDTATRALNPLEQAILDKGVVKSAAALDVSAFISRQIDVQLLNWCATAIAEHYRGKQIDKIVTIEAGGIAIATLVALAMELPLVVGKKAATILDNAELLSTEVKSFTKNTQYTLTMDSRHFSPNERVLFVDDFLAHGQAVLGMQEICQQAGVTLAGLGIVIEKSFQHGAQIAEDNGIAVLSLAQLASLEPAVSFKGL